MPVARVSCILAILGVLLIVMWSDPGLLFFLCVCRSLSPTANNGVSNAGWWPLENNGPWSSSLASQPVAMQCTSYTDSLLSNG